MVTPGILGHIDPVGLSGSKDEREARKLPLAIISVMVRLSSVLAWLLSFTSCHIGGCSFVIPLTDRDEGM